MTYVLNAWLVSPYSAKVRAYLDYKALPYREHAPTGVELLRRVQKAVGAAIMPTVETPSGEWLQDSSVIIDTLERRHPERPTTPLGATQRVAQLLLELHGDEWLPLSAMHYRWNRHENARFAIDEFARTGFPKLPLPLARLAAKTMSDKMSGYRAVLGVTAETIPGVERFTESLIAQLDAHFAQHDFFLGSRPGIADFAMYGPLWAHLYRDPASRYLFDQAPNVRAWFTRLQEPSGYAGDFLADDVVPATLDPVFRTLFAEQFEFVTALIQKVDAYCAEHPEATRVPRALGVHPHTIGGYRGERKLVTYTHWMAQRAIDAFHAIDPKKDPTGRETAEAWLARVGGLEAMQKPIDNPQERRSYKMRLAR